MITLQPSFKNIYMQFSKPDQGSFFLISLVASVTPSDNIKDYVDRRSGTCEARDLDSPSL